MALTGRVVDLQEATGEVVLGIGGAGDGFRKLHIADRVSGGAGLVHDIGADSCGQSEFTGCKVAAAGLGITELATVTQDSERAEFFLLG